KVQNAARAGHEKVDVPTSKMKLEIVKILKTEGYIKNFKKARPNSPLYCRNRLE
ncbi:MAG: 30S ribosomal protein S8, partial [Bacteroidales bacterium]|nr:30S ribosomal protein S8 [Bacteroidales bacterium]